MAQSLMQVGQFSHARSQKFGQCFSDNASMRFNCWVAPLTRQHLIFGNFTLRSETGIEKKSKLDISCGGDGVQPPGMGVNGTDENKK